MSLVCWNTARVGKCPISGNLFLSLMLAYARDDSPPFVAPICVLFLKPVLSCFISYVYIYISLSQFCRCVFNKFHSSSINDYQCLQVGTVPICAPQFIHGQRDIFALARCKRVVFSETLTVYGS